MVKKISLALILLISLPSAVYALKDEIVYEGQQVIWGFDFVNQDEILFTERNGQIKHLKLSTKKVTELKVPLDVFKEGQGGLLDLNLHPDFQKNKLVYFTYSKNLGKNIYTTALASFQFNQTRAENFKDVFVAKAEGKNDIHFGSRFVWDKNGNLFLTVGDRNERDKAQDLKFHNGKIIKLDKKNQAEIWSYGHRNPQGIGIHPASGDLYEVEFGPRGGDEVNLIEKGKNYGWPVITYGREYSGPKIGEGTAKAGMEQPIIHWTPSISPSGMAFYQGDKFPQWKNHLFLACLSGLHLRRLQIDQRKVVSEEKLLADKSWRIRQVRSGPDGYLYISTDAGNLVRLKPD